MNKYLMALSPKDEEPPFGEYAFEISTNTGDHGSISTDRYSVAGEQVFVRVFPEEGYILDTLIIEQVDGTAMEYWSNEPMVYTFIMPRSDVRITATFVEDENWEPSEPGS